MRLLFHDPSGTFEWCTHIYVVIKQSGFKIQGQNNPCDIKTILMYVEEIDTLPWSAESHSHTWIVSYACQLTGPSQLKGLCLY